MKKLLIILAVYLGIGAALTFKEGFKIDKGYGRLALMSVLLWPFFLFQKVIGNAYRLGSSRPQ